MELSFEYLVARNELQWITIVSEQAILMSVCLQAMIDELLQKCVVGSKTQVRYMELSSLLEHAIKPLLLEVNVLTDPQTVPGKSWTYIMRDGQSRITMGSPSRERANKDHSPKSGPIMKKLADKWSAVKLKRADDSITVINRTQRMRTADSDIMENNAFRVIGDDDL